MGKDSTVSSRVLAWRGTAMRVRESLGLTERDIPMYVIMAVIAMESSGDPTKVGGQHLGLMQIGRKNAATIKDAGTPRTPSQFDGRNANVLPLGIHDATYTVANPELVAAENSLRHFCEYIDLFRERIGGDPYRMAMCWKAGPGAVLQFNEAVGGPSTVAALSEEGIAYFRAEENNSDGYLQDAARLIPEAQEKLGEAPTTTYSPTSGRAVTSYPATESPYATSTARPMTSALRKPGCKPAHERRYIAPSSARLELAQSAKTNLLQASEINYVQSIKYYLADLGQLARTGRPQYSKKAVTNIETFLQDVENDDNSGVARNLRAAFAFVPSNFVKPLEVFDVRQEFGQTRVRTLDGQRVTRRHLGVDLETRDPAEVARNLQTAQFVTGSSTPPRNLFGQKPCYAIADGEVITAGIVSKYGYCIILAHAGGVTSRYAHLAKIEVAVGETVAKGQRIGVTGTTEELTDSNGRGTGRPDHSAVTIPHLHFEIRVNVGALRGSPTSLTQNTQNIALDPAAILAQAPGPLDPPAVAKRPEEAAVEAGLAAQASLLLGAATDHGRLKSAEAYDAMAAQARSQAVRNMSRADYYTEQSRVAPISRNVQEQSVSLDPQIYAEYSAAPLAAGGTLLPASSTGIAGVAGIEQVVSTVRTDDQYDRQVLTQALEDRLVTLNSAITAAESIDDSNLRQRVTSERQNVYAQAKSAYDAIVAGSGTVVAKTVEQGGLSADLLQYAVGDLKVRLLQISAGETELTIEGTV